MYATDDIMRFQAEVVDGLFALTRRMPARSSGSHATGTSPFA
jgi:hypothetical protein